MVCEGVTQELKAIKNIPPKQQKIPTQFFMFIFSLKNKYPKKEDTSKMPELFIGKITVLSILSIFKALIINIIEKKLGIPRAIPAIKFFLLNLNYFVIRA